MNLKDFEGELGLLRLAEATEDDLVKNRNCIARGATHPIENHIVNWFLPPVTHALKGGVRTVFMLAQDLSEHWGTLNNFVIYSYSGRDISTAELCSSLVSFFPNLRFTISVFKKNVDHISVVPASNVSFCTLWTTAYLQLQYNKTSRKFYLMQDYEPNFYQAGNMYGVIEQTYRFGFSCISNTEGVGNKYKQYSDDVIIFTPGVDRKIFFPNKQKTSIGNPARVVFYGRPSNPRNCFLVGLQTLTALKRKLNDGIEIISVGEDWDVKDFGVEGVIENWGLLGSMEEVAELYRTADVGLVFMMTPHPSYQPLEYMASGCVTATNINESNQWLLNHENALLVEPIPEVAAQKMYDLLRDSLVWRHKQENAYETIRSLSWDSVFNAVKARLSVR